MRLILATAGIALLASSGSAMAADCTRGLLWPYVRHPGDCLTDAEIQTGKTGVYTGPATGQVDVSTIKPPAQLNSASANAIQCSHSWYWPFGSGDCQAAPAAAASSSAGSGATAGSSTAKDNPPAGLPAAQPASSTPVGKPQAAASPAAPPAQPIAAASPSTAASCTKGAFWPFIRGAGDCPTGAERSNGSTPAVPTAASEPAPMPVSIPPPAQPAPVMQPVTVASPPVAASCSKGIFWPFIRESGDCARAAENGNGKTSTAPIAATERAAMPVSVPPPAAAAPVMQPVADASPPPAATCSRGTFWPFIREVGDCPTAAEKGSGKTSAVPIDANETAANPVAVPAVATMPEQAPPAQNGGPPAADQASCHKGLFWPFVRATGDCPTDAGKGTQRSPF